MNTVSIGYFCVFLIESSAIGAGTVHTEKARYLRPAGKQFATECEFTLTRAGKESTTESVTYRGQTKMSVTARHDDKGMLATAEVVLWTGEQKKSAQVKVAGGKAKVQREAQPVQEFEAAPGVIVTSAPDWTDTFLLCRRYDRNKGGKQQFAGLWIHPVESSQHLTFTIEKQGQAVIEHAGRKLTLDRLAIWLRGNSAYAAWTDGEGRMIKLLPLPTKEGATNWLVLQGYEMSAAGLRP